MATTVWRVFDTSVRPEAVSVRDDADVAALLYEDGYYVTEDDAWTRVLWDRNESLALAKKEMARQAKFRNTAIANHAEYRSGRNSSSSDCAAPQCAEPGSIS